MGNRGGLLGSDVSFRKKGEGVEERDGYGRRLFGTVSVVRRAIWGAADCLVTKCKWQGGWLCGS